MKRSLINAVLIALVLGGCRKEPLPAADPGEPVFFVSCVAGGVPLRLEAGNDDYYMTPDFFRDSNGVYVLKAELAKKGCQDCYALTIMVNDHMTSPANAPIHIDSALKLGHYLFNDKSLLPTQYQVVLKPELDFDSTGSYQWSIAEAGQNTVFSSGYTISANFDALKTYTVAMQYQDATGCFTSHFNIIKLGAGAMVDISATRQSTSDLIFQFSAANYTASIQSYHWEFGDGTSSAEPSPVHPYIPIPNGGYYTATLTVTDMAGQASKAYYQIPGIIDQVCMANFRADVKPIPNMKAYSKITIELRDPAGKVYTTRDFVQPAGSTFEIVSIDDYKANAQGLPTKKFRALFDCLLKTGSEELRITSGEAVVAVAYK